MSALAATKNYPLRGASKQSFRIANATQLYVGSYAALNSSGLLVPFTGANGQLLVGRVESGCQPASDGTLTLLGDTSAVIPPEAACSIEPEILEKVTVAGASTLALALGKAVYLNATDNASADLTLTRPSTGAVSFGIVVRWYSGTTCDVLVLGFADRVAGAQIGSGQQLLSLGHFELASLDAGAGPTNLNLAIPAPFRGRILSTFWYESTLAAGGPGTLTPSIGGTVVTGGAVVIGNNQAKFTNVAGTAVTAGNEFHQGDLLSLSESTVTAFTAGNGEFWLVVEKLPGV